VATRILCASAIPLANDRSTRSARSSRARRPISRSSKATPARPIPNGSPRSRWARPGSRGRSGLA